MNQRIQSSIAFQYRMGRLAVFFVGPLIILAIRLAGYRIRDLGQVRRQVAEIMREHQGPWLICPNHLTLIDSFILAYAMFPLHRYVLQYQLVPWNVPEYMNFSRNIFVAALCYLLKCVPVKRGGERADVRLTLEKCAYLLSKKENLMIFPEGTRSRTGRVDTRDFTYNVGRLFAQTPGCRVLCIYMRGDGQDTYSSLPKFGETFSVAAAECRPQTAYKGLRAYRDYATQIIKQLAGMEAAYFASRGK